MNSRERILTVLNHKEADRVPFDLAGTHVSGIHVIAYRNLCKFLGVDPEPIEFTDVIQQIVQPKIEILSRLEVDTRGLFPLCSHNWNVNVISRGEYSEYQDEWGFLHHKPDNGFYWSLVKSPLDGMSISAEAIHSYPWPDPEDRRRLNGLRAKAIQYRQEGKLVIIKGFCAGVFEMMQRVRGMENCLCDLLADPVLSGVLLDKLLELKQKFWSSTLNEIGDLVDIVVETDDYGTQNSQLISVEIFKSMILPRLRELVQYVKTTLNSKKPAGQKGYIFFHSCGNVRPFIPDFIDIGIDIINPVHITAAGMEPYALKRDFGTEITFWGGGVDTQNILPRGTSGQVRDDVRRNLEALMPGGGYVFNTVHNIQAEVPPENIMAMREALVHFGRY